MDEKIMRYLPFSSFVDPGFWHKFTQIKLDVDKLQESRKCIYGNFSYQTNISNLFEVNSTAFNSTANWQKHDVVSYGILLNKNTIEDFKDCDKVELLRHEGQLLARDIENGTCIENPSLLSRFLMLSFADLKKYQYFYWFAFPAPSAPISFYIKDPYPMNVEFNQNQLVSLIKSHYNLHVNQKPYFYIDVEDELATAVPISTVVNNGSQQDLSVDVNAKKIYYGFIDSSNSEYAGWSLRNLIALLTYHCPGIRGKTVSFISLRLRPNGDPQDSLIFDVCIPKELSDQWANDWVGWERNESGKFGPRFANMATSMDPIMLAESSVDLNLKLMKWRLLPDLDLNLINKTKCLLLGAGTLGCCVARNLMAWGIRHITFIDNGKVSFSNPVRQNLFNHEDCLNGGKPKATAAADNLKKIFPGVSSSGIAMHIPMPGHPVGDSLKTQTLRDIERLTEVIAAHDVVFLLLDSREARWLPTLLAAHFGKLAINAALGFDSYLVMRHGITIEKMVVEGDADESSGAGSEEETRRHSIPGNMLGCYFCNDVTAPGNSQKDRTLDQQCTVTRPGVANIAGALAAEITVAITQHKQNINAPAPYNMNERDGSHAQTDSDGILGPIPHSIRGFLSSYQQVLPTSIKFDQCIACSPSVVNLYRTKGVEFLLQVFDSAKYLEDVTGLTKLHADADVAEMWALSDSEDE